MFNNSNRNPKSTPISGTLNLPDRLTSRKKVVLAPGHSPLDWADLTARSSDNALRGLPSGTPPAPYVRVTTAELKQHKIKADCWTCINGKVFNITPYIDFHPGGEKEIMKCAGSDGTFLFNKYHSWVNPDRLLAKCMVGILVDHR